VALAATYTLRVEGDNLLSNPSCWKESRTLNIFGVIPVGRTPFNEAQNLLI